MSESASPIWVCSPKKAWLFWGYLLSKNIFQEIFDGEILATTKLTTLLQMFCELLLYSRVIFRWIKDPDNNFKRKSEA